MVKILVTGGAGFIGSNLVTKLTPEYQVIVVDNLVTGKLENLSDSVKFYQADVSSEKLLGIVATEQPEAIIHLAAQTDVGNSLKDPYLDLRSNILGTLNVLEAVRANRVKKVVFASTAAVYGNPVHLPIGEDHPIKPLAPYGVSKYAAELYLQAYAVNYGVNFTILRFANVYGPRQQANAEGGVVAIFCRRLINGEPVTIYGTGEQTRDFVYVGDIAAALCEALRSGPNQIYNVGTGTAISIKQLYGNVQKLLNVTGEPDYQPARPGDIQRSCFNASKIAADLGWKARIDIHQGVKETINWFQRINT